jgi:hypothetical protein
MMGYGARSTVMTALAVIENETDRLIDQIFGLLPIEESRLHAF